MMWKWDQYFGGGHTTAKLAHLMKGKISKLPSDYFGTNIFIGASTMSREEIRRRYVIGCDVMMWGTDYPHPEGTWPDTVGVLKRSFHDVPVDDTAKLVGLTAASVYGMDVPTLRQIADHIGPTPEDLGQDPSLRADPDEVAKRALVERGVRRQGHMTLAPFRIEIPDERLARLRDRLRTTVWADEPSAAPTTGRSACRVRTCASW